MLQTRWLDKFNDALPADVKHKFRETALEEIETHPWVRAQLGERRRAMDPQELVSSDSPDKEPDTTASRTSGLSGGIMELVKKYPGGLTGLLQGFREDGASDIVNSWISRDENLPISPEQIQRVVGRQHIEQLAAKAGLSVDAAGSKLAELLPVLVDRSSPSGKLEPRIAPRAGDAALDQKD